MSILPFIGSGIHACRLHWKQVIQHVHRILHWGRITAWPHHWMFTAVTVLVPSACALASCMEQHFTSSMSDLWSFPRTFIRCVYSYISLPVKSKTAICDGVGMCPIYLKFIIPLIYNPTIQLCRWNLQSNHGVCLGHIIPSWVGVLGTSPKLI